MRPTDQVQVVSVQELRHHIRPERERHATVVLAPSLHVFVRVGPEQVAEETLTSMNERKTLTFFGHLCPAHPWAA